MMNIGQALVNIDRGLKKEEGFFDDHKINRDNVGIASTKDIGTVVYTSLASLENGDEIIAYSDGKSEDFGMALLDSSLTHMESFDDKRSYIIEKIEPIPDSDIKKAFSKLRLLGIKI